MYLQAIEKVLQKLLSIAKLEGHIYNTGGGGGGGGGGNTHAQNAGKPKLPMKTWFCISI